jgi:hypothetical protein
MIVSEIKLYELLKAKLGEKEAEAFVEILEKKVDHKFEDAKQTLATKEDLANTKVDLIKWMVALLLGLFIALVGAMAAIIKLMIN